MPNWKKIFCVGLQNLRVILDKEIKLLQEAVVRASRISVVDLNESSNKMWGLGSSTLTCEVFSHV